ncbi:hypothetical protein JQF37_25465 [Pseudomonas sp. MIL9]|uniref:hypothetical protein n=1 Tax=Pseudomonas sp. MIL9 TaxID=2807620 RepID=UPI00194F37B0|nr:hypothetical protein [Pseudomonas sp. MIL9]MBM6446951.1 hypothetical protein [Pseudomonas sp. MIL9]
MMKEKSTDTLSNRHWRPFLITLIFSIYTLVSFGFYYERTLNGNIDNHILSSEIFGIPKNIENHGVKPLYQGDKDTGWDGQFYYYMSNDIFGTKDAAAHIDTPPYRYQRIGLSLYTAIIAKSIGKRWVSPAVFFSSYFLLLLIATWAGARLFVNRGAPPELILLWALSIGTQITLFNALPDAAADAFLIIAFLTWFSERRFISSILFTFAALSREVYIIFPISILLLNYLQTLSIFPDKSIKGLISNTSRLIPKYILTWLTLPIIITTAWHAYVYFHFKKLDSKEVEGILGFPLKAWIEYFISGVSGNHLLLGRGLPAYAEAASLLVFIIILIITFSLAIRTLFLNKNKAPDFIKGAALTCILLTAIYLCFGATVIAHYSGYLKAIGVFFFLIPLMLETSTTRKKTKTIIYLALIASIMATSTYNFRARLLPFPPDDNITNMSKNNETRSFSCLKKYDAQITIDNIKLHKASFLSNAFGAKNKIVITLNLTNTSDESFVSGRNAGNVNMSSNWIDDQGVAVTDGVRSALPFELPPGQSVTVTVISYLPKDKGHYRLKLSPVQEGCAWFYNANPNIAETIGFELNNG